MVHPIVWFLTHQLIWGHCPQSCHSVVRPASLLLSPFPCCWTHLSIIKPIVLLLDLSHCHWLHLDAVESILPSSNLSSCHLVSLVAVESIALLNLSWHHGTHLAICLHHCGLSYASVALSYTLHSCSGPWHCHCQVAEGWQVLGCSCHCLLCWYLLPLSWGHVAMLSLGRPAYHCYGSHIAVTSVAKMGFGSHGIIQSLGMLLLVIGAVSGGK